MGLCKCPKRKVTNLFCFEHKVNVCEHCLVADHVRCVIKSYLQWLQDSDFDTACCICQDTLEAGDVVRLLCYDVLHVSCAEKFLLAYPPHTAPDGFFCPACHSPFLPPDVAVSPVADQLRVALNGMKDLQKRLQGLSAAVPEQSKSLPPTDRRPEPEGKEGRDDPINDPVNDPINDLHQQEQLAMGSSDRAAQTSIHSSHGEEFSPEKELTSKDDPESDTLSSASDFIATHPGSHGRGVEGRVSPVSSPPLPPPPPTELLSSVPALVTSYHGSSALIAQSVFQDESFAGIIPNALPNVPAAEDAAFSSPLRGIAHESAQNVVVEVEEKAFTHPYGSSSVDSMTVPMETISATSDASASVFSSAPLAALKGASTSSAKAIPETNVDMSWSLSASNYGETSGAVNSYTAVNSFTAANSLTAVNSLTAANTFVEANSFASAARSMRESEGSVTLPRQASFTNAGPEYSTATQLPFSGKKFDLWDFSRLPQSAKKSPAGKFAVSARASSTSSASSYIPRVPQSFPTSVPREDHDDHKYRRKPLMEVVRTWLKIFSPPRGRRSTPSLWRRFVIIVLVAVLSLICLILLFHHLGRSGRDDDDPLLDLKANPFVKVDDS